MRPQESIAHYRIVSKLGEGGMGAVYRATDTRLNREVAIKVLTAALADDPDYLARFTREAHVLASLNHPNVATIYGVEEKALIMELVPGETLEERIAAGPVPVEEALSIAAQISEALEAAHEKGVTHRDLKPANVKVTPEGVVKVLDFGLAKAADSVESPSGVNSPTLTIRATQAGVIVGTAAYMAPEQASGRPVDRRADIWSFGVVLYEMLTGGRLFTGESFSHTLASVLKDPIRFELPQAPPPIRRLLERCLTRNPKDRLRDIGEARIAIRAWLAHPSIEAAATAPPKAGSRRRLLASASAAVLLMALAAALAWLLKPSPPRPVTRFTFILPPDQGYTARNRSALAISPDGTEMVYAANLGLYLHEMSQADARPIPGTGLDDGRGAMHPVFSPDGNSLVFVSGASPATVKRIAVSGGVAVTIATLPTPWGVSWGDAGILCTDGSGIVRISPNGGTPEMLVAAKDGEAMADAQSLPGGEAVLFTRAARSFNQSPPEVAVQVLKSGARKILVQGAAGARYLPTGHLVYWMNGILFAAPFSLRRLEIAGNPVAVVEGVYPTIGGGQFAFSNTGTLIYLPGPVTTSGSEQSVLVRVDRHGNVEPLKVPPAAYASPRASKDGKRIAYQIEETNESGIWIWELSGDTAPRRLTLPGTRSNRYPVWSPDGQRIAFQSDREGDPGIWWQRADGNGPAERLTRPAQGIAHIPDSWSPDGQTLSFTEQQEKTSALWTWSLRDRKTTLFASDPNAGLGMSAFSPDGRWVAYQSRPQGAPTRIYVSPFPPTETAYLAPQDGDMHHPAWSPNGKELFYSAGPSQAGSVSFIATAGVSFGTPVRQRRSGFHTGGPSVPRTYDVLPDGQHLIGTIPAGQAQSTSDEPQIQVVLNWFENVKQRVQGR